MLSAAGIRSFLESIPLHGRARIYIHLLMSALGSVSHCEQGCSELEGARFSVDPSYGIAGFTVRVIPCDGKMPHCFPKGGAFCFPRSSLRKSQCLVFLSALGTASLFDFSHFPGVCFQRTMMESSSACADWHFTGLVPMSAQSFAAFKNSFTVFLLNRKVLYYFVDTGLYEIMSMSIMNMLPSMQAVHLS